MSNLVIFPDVIVKIAGRALTATESQALVQIRVQQRLSAPTLCELYFHGSVGSLDVVTTLSPGVAMQVRLVDHPTPLFVGQITAIEYIYGPTGEEEICVRGYDALHILRQRQQVQAYLDLSVGDLARALTGDMGLSIAAQEDGPSWPMIVQHRQNNLELLVEMAAYSGHYLTVREDTLHLFTLAGEGASEALRLGESLLEARFEINADAVSSEVTVSGWNALDTTRQFGSASRARSGQQIHANTRAEEIGGDGTLALVNETLPTSEHATALAQAALDACQGRAVSFWGVAAGNPALRPGISIQVSGVANHLTGDYVLTSVTHTIDGELGFVSELNTRLPQLPARPQGSVVTVGMVLQVDDPEQRGRVRVTLPTFNDVETDWLGLLLPAAGPNKGFIALPDVGDTVLVLLPQATPAVGIVLGGLYGTQRPPDSGVSRNAVRRYTWITPGGQQIQLNDAGNTVRLENESGSYIELSGGDVVIAGQSIDLRRS